jgi:uncharacterized protein DUF6894
MPRYFFHIQDSAEEKLIDEEGSEHANLDAARQEALESAREIMSQAAFSGKDVGHLIFQVADQDDKTVLELPFKGAVKGRRAL